MLYHLKRLWLGSRPLQICTLVFIVGFGWKSVTEAAGYRVPLPGWFGGGSVPVPTTILDGGVKLVDKTIKTGNQVVDVTGRIVGTGEKIIDGIDGIVNDVFGGGQPVPPPATSNP